MLFIQLAIFSIPPVIWALLASAGIAGWSLLSRHIMRGEKDNMAVAVVNENLSAIWLILAVLIFGVSTLGDKPFEPSTIPLVGWGALLFSIALYTASGLLSYKVFQEVEASERAVVSQAQIVWVVLLGVILLREPFGIGVALGALLVIVGSLLCTYRPGKHRWNSPGVKLTVLVTLIYGTASMADKVALAYFPALLYTVPMYFFPGIAAIAFLGSSAMKRTKVVIRRYGMKFVLFSALSVLPYMAYLLALQSLPASVVSPLLSTNVVLTALGGMLLLGEHEGWPQKIVGAILAVGGAWMLSG